MRVPIFTAAIPLLAALGFAQDTQPPQSQQPTVPSAPAMVDKTTKDKSNDKDKTAGQPSGVRAEEMKTQNYSGFLTDASCAASNSVPPTPAPSASTGSSAASADNQSCSVSASTTQFALKLKDGKTVKFDDVGNLRAQEAFKTHKKWSDAASASKPVRVSVGGVLNGDQMTVMSIN